MKFLTVFIVIFLLSTSHTNAQEKSLGALAVKNRKVWEVGNSDVSITVYKRATATGPKMKNSKPWNRASGTVIKTVSEEDPEILIKERFTQVKNRCPGRALQMLPPLLFLIFLAW